MNGTFLNGNRIEKGVSTPLTDDDVITFMVVTCRPLHLISFEERQMMVGHFTFRSVPIVAPASGAIRTVKRKRELTNLEAYNNV